MQAWGFTGFGKWSSNTGNLPILPVLEAYNVPILVLHPDIFDPNVQAQFQTSLQQQMQGSVNNRRSWAGRTATNTTRSSRPAEVTEHPRLA
jgi:hypothetical protein